MHDTAKLIPQKPVSKEEKKALGSYNLFKGSCTVNYGPTSASPLPLDFPPPLNSATCSVETFGGCSVSKP
jgi:hypothetical protein